MSRKFVHERFLTQSLPIVLSYKIQLTGATAGVCYGAFQWAYYPDRFTYGHKGTVLPGPARGIDYLKMNVMRPAVYFSLIGITFAAVEGFMEEVRGNKSLVKDPWNTAVAGFASGMVMGGFYTRRLDVASMTGLGIGLLMGAIEFNGPSLIADAKTQKERMFSEKVPVKFEESKELAGLKEKYPAYKDL